MKMLTPFLSLLKDNWREARRAGVNDFISLRRSIIQCGRVVMDIIAAENTNTGCVLPHDASRIDTTKIGVRMDAAASHPNINADLSLPRIPLDHNATM